MQNSSNLLNVRNAGQSGSVAEDDVIIGDIHYRPIVLMLFLVVAFIGSMWFAYATPYALPALLFSAGFAVVLVGLARLRANTIGLRLPDVAGVELPIAVAMVGMVLVHVAGRMTTGVLTDSTVHLAALSLTLVLLVGMVGWKKRSWLANTQRLEALLGLMVIDRIVCVLIGGEVPLPLATDPTALTFATGGLPLFGIEALLLGMVVLFDWVEGERLRRGLDDHRTALGRSGWVVGTVALSMGPVSLLALALGLRRSVGWKQPAVAMTVMLSAPFAVQALVAWALASAASVLTPAAVAATFGAGSVVWAVVVVARNDGLWLSAALWSAHGLLLPAAVLSSSLVGLSLAALVVSTTAWVSGILTQRKSGESWGPPTWSWPGWWLPWPWWQASGRPTCSSSSSLRQPCCLP